MAKVLAQGRQVLFLLPEINLTPQLLKRVETVSLTCRPPCCTVRWRQASARRINLRAMLGQAEAGDRHAAGGVYAFA